MKIPNDNNPILSQTNRSSKLGYIIESYNLDLTSDLGKIKTTKALLSKISSGTTDTPTDFGSTQALGVGSIKTLGSSIYLISGSNIWVGGDSPIDTISIDTATGTPDINIQKGDLESFNSTLYATNSSYIYKYSSGGLSWSSVYTYSTGNQEHLLETHKGYLYFSFDYYKIGRIDTSDTPTVSGTGSLNLNLPGFHISFMRSDGEYLWIGLVNTTGGHDEFTYIYKWDGSTTGNAQNQYKILSRAVLSGCIKNGIPYAIDGNGRLLEFNGILFKEIDRFPLKSNEYLGGIGSNHDRAIHPNGMIYDSINDEILINVSNTRYFASNIPQFYDWSGGVWSYKADTGLHNKYSASLQPITSSGVSGLIDYGQKNVIFGGAINTLGLRVSDTTSTGRVIFGQVIYKGISKNYTTEDSAYVVLCADDTLNKSQKNGYFITTEIMSSKIQETWQEIYAIYKNLLNSSDEITIKYRTRKDIPTNIPSLTWSETDTLTTTTDVSDYGVGDELQINQGYGSGMALKIKSITESGGVYSIRLYDNMTTDFIEKQSSGKISKWIEAGKVTNTDDLQYKLFAISKENTSPRIQIKCCMKWTGDNELDYLYLKNKNNI